MKKKILFFAMQLSHGGVDRSLIEAFKILDPSKYDITLFLRYGKTDLISLLPDYVKVIIDKDPHYFRRPKALWYRLLVFFFSRFNSKYAQKFSLKLDDYIYLKKIENPRKRYFRNDYFDVVISYTINICTDMSLLIDAGKYVVFFHSEEADFHLDMTERVFPQFDYIVAIASGVEMMLREAFPQFNDKIIQICNYVDALNIIDQSKVIPDEINETHSKGEIMLVTSSRMDIEKGYELAVGAAKTLRDNGVDFEWYFLGDGSERSHIEDLIKEYSLDDQIKTKGFVMNPYPYISECDIYIQPSHLESQSLALVEAIIFGKAIVSTDTLGGKTVLDYGKKGLLVSKSAESIAKGIMELLNNPGLKRSFENKYTLEDNYNEKKEYIRKWDELLNE